MRLPPVDVYRAPFVEPIGHVTMQAAYAEEELINLCSVVPHDGSPLQLAVEVVAKRLRNFTASAEEFINERLSLIAEDHVKAEALDAVSRFLQLRTGRHRAVHDAVTIGIFEAEGDKYVVQPLGVEYRTASDDKSKAEQLLYTITPEQVAELACELHEVQKDFSSIAYMITNPRDDR